MLTQIYIHLGVALAGLVSFLSPCVLPLVPPYLGYLGGTTIEQMTGRDELDTAPVAAGGAGLGVLRARLHHRVRRARRRRLGVRAVDADLQGASSPSSPASSSSCSVCTSSGCCASRCSIARRGCSANVEGASLAGAYVMGLAFAFGWTPCIGPVLATVLTLAASEASLGAGVRLLLVYSLGLGIPFVLAAVAIGPFLGFVQRFRHHLRRVEMAMGAGAGGDRRADADRLAQLIRASGCSRTCPMLGRIEELATPERLQTEILKEGMGK